MISTLALRAVKTLLIFLLTVGSLAAQQGGYFLSQHLPDKNFDEASFDIIQDQNGLTFVANRSGILVFDGKRWDFLKTSSAIFSLAVSTYSQSVYTSGRNGFGVIEKDKFFHLTYKDLSDSSQINADIFSVLNHNNKLHGINEESVFVYDLATNTSTSMKPKRGGYLTDIVLFEGKVYIANTLSGILELREGKLSTPGNKSLQGVFVNTMVSTADGSMLIFEREDGTLWTLFKSELKKIPLETEDLTFLIENQLQQIKWMDDDLLALSTLRGGIVFLNTRNGKFLQVIDGQNGLPNNEIYTINTDIESNLWIAHSKGFTRVSPSAALRSFSAYPGLDGDILTAVMHKGKLFVGTANGLYSLEAVAEYVNEEYYESKEVLKKVPTTSAEAEKSNPKKTRKGFLGFLKKKQNKQQDKVDQGDSMPEFVKKTLVQRKVRKKLHSVEYRYEKLDGLNSKVTELISNQGRLLAAGLDGFFEIKDNKQVAILKEPVRSFFYSEHYQAAFIGTINNEIKVFDMRSDIRELYLFGDFSSYTSHIFEDSHHKVWLCGTAKMIWLTIHDQGLDETGEIEFDNPFFYETYGVGKSGQVMFINAEGEYKLEKNVIRKTGEPRKVVKGSNGQIWTLTEDGWSLFGGTQTSKQFSLLNAFKNPQYLAKEGQNIWLVSNNSLLRLSSTAKEEFSSSYNLLLRGISTDSSNLQPSGKLLVDQDKSAIKFEYVKPEYTGIMNIQYQYKLDGLAVSKWTDWSTDFSTIIFPYLPEGDYKLNVRSKDSFGIISSAKEVEFKVVPPYWKRSWFYALEFTALGLLLVILLRIKRLYRYRLGGRLLVLLILIIIIEFIQTIAENEFQTKSSAVFDFTIQVVVAIIVLPLEGLLRKYIFKEQNVQFQDFFRTREKKQTDES